MELKQANSLFNDCYKLYKSFCDSKLDNDDLHEFLKAVTLLKEKYRNDFADGLLMAVIDEIDRIEKGK